MEVRVATWKYVVEKTSEDRVDFAKVEAMMGQIRQDRIKRNEE